MDWISAASSTHAPSPTEVGSRSGQPRYRQRDVLTAPSPSASGSRFGVPPTLSQLLEDSPASYVGWTTHPNTTRGLSAPGIVETKFLGQGE